MENVVLFIFPFQLTVTLNEMLAPIEEGRACRWMNFDSVWMI
jgi:hypothetical protein